MAGRYTNGSVSVFLMVLSIDMTLYLRFERCYDAPGNQSYLFLKKDMVFFLLWMVWLPGCGEILYGFGMPAIGKEIWRECAGEYRKALPMVYMTGKKAELKHTGYSIMIGTDYFVRSTSSMREPADLHTEYPSMKVGKLHESDISTFPGEEALKPEKNCVL